MVVLTCPAAVVAEQALMTTFLPAEALMTTFLPAAAAAPPPQMTAEGAVWQAGAEGLTLLRSDNVTGYRGVYFATRALHHPPLPKSPPSNAQPHRAVPSRRPLQPAPPAPQALL